MDEATASAPALRRGAASCPVAADHLTVTGWRQRHSRLFGSPCLSALPPLPWDRGTLCLAVFGSQQLAW